MEFGLSDEQLMLRDSVQGTLARITTLTELRNAISGAAPVSEATWVALAEMGAMSALVPEEFGGMGVGTLDAALIHQEIGRVVAPVPLLGVTAGIVAFREAASHGQQAEWLPKLASGELRLSIAVNEHVSLRGDQGVREESGRLSGSAMFAIDTAPASHFIVADREGFLHLVDAGENGLVVDALSTLDKTRSFAALTFDKVKSEKLNANTNGKIATQRVVDATRVFLAAEILGAAQVMIQKAVAYSQERSQFGRLIGTFQAVKHLCAEMAAHLEPCQALMWYAAYAQDHRKDEALRMAGHAKAHLSEIGRFVARTSTEVHGGIGLTEALGLEYWFKRIEVNRQLLGSPETIRQEVARDQGWGRGTRKAV